MEKVAFTLEIEDDWPPVATECVWYRHLSGNYVLENLPFFISGLTHGHEFSAIPDPVNGCIFEFELVKTSGHSIVWAMNNIKLYTD